MVAIQGRFQVVGFCRLVLCASECDSGNHRERPGSLVSEREFFAGGDAGARISEADLIRIAESIR